jgi:hypothetical protein
MAPAYVAVKRKVPLFHILFQYGKQSFPSSLNEAKDASLNIRANYATPNEDHSPNAQHSIPYAEQSFAQHPVQT